jgi:DNA-binding CsgD family transcriptional regulator
MKTLFTWTISAVFCCALGGVLGQVPDSTSKRTEQEQLDFLYQRALRTVSTDPVSSIQDAEGALRKAQKLSDSVSIALGNKILGNANYLLGNYPEALDRFILAYQWYGFVQDTASMAGMKASQALVYKETEDYPKALEANENALALAESIGHVGIQAKILNNIGVIHRRQKTYKEARLYFEKSLNMKKSLGDVKGVSNSYTNLGNLSVVDNDYAQAMDFFRKSLAIEDSLGSEEGIAKNLNNIANLYQLQNRYEEAIDYATRGLAIGQKLGTKVQIKEASHVLAESYYRTGAYNQAYPHYKRYHAMSDSLFNEEKARKIGRMESKLALAQQQRKLDKLEEEHRITALQLSQKRSQQLYFVIIGCLILIVLVYVLFSQRQKNRLREKALLGEISELRTEIRSLTGKYEGNLEVSREELNAKLHNPLSEREYDVFRLVFSQKTNMEIAEELFVSINTVKTHLRNLYSKLGVSNRREALELIIKNG